MVLRQLPLIDSRIHNDWAADRQITSPMPGSITACFTLDGDHVEAGTPVLAMQAMKMEHTLTALVTGRVSLSVTVDDQVTDEQLLAEVTPEDTEAGRATADRGPATQW